MNYWKYHASCFFFVNNLIYEIGRDRQFHFTDNALKYYISLIQNSKLFKFSGSGARGLTHGLHGTDSLGRAAHGSALWVWLSQKLEALGAQVDEQLSVLGFQAAHALNSDQPSRWDAEEPRIQGTRLEIWQYHGHITTMSKSNHLSWMFQFQKTAIFCQNYVLLKTS